MIHKFRNIFISEVSKGIPGEASHKKMYPSIRPSNNKTISRNASVMILIYLKNETLHTIFIRRPEDGTIHSGQVSLPGGKEEPADHDLIETGIRETHEEIGIELKKTEIVSSLTPIHIKASNFIVQPIVAMIDYNPIFSADAKEVASLIETPIQALTDDMNQKVKLFSSHGVTFSAPYYDIQGEVIWGATAIIITEFTDILKRNEEMLTFL